MIYRAHNVERDIWLRGSVQAELPRKLLLREQGWLVGRFEEHISRRVRMVLPVSDDDAAIFSDWADDVQTVPIGMETPEVTAVPSGAPNILFVGRLDWPPNREGLQWVLENVWPQVIARRPELTLTIVGSGSSEWLAPFATLPGVSFLGRVDTLAPYYDACAAALVPVFFGSGTRVKAIEASLHARVCISTAVGVEGLPLRSGCDFIRAESAEQWIDAIAELTVENAGRLGLSARERTGQKFDRMDIVDTLLRSLADRGLLAPP